MNETAFVDRRQADWARLGELCDRAERSLKGLTGDEFSELVKLYRRSSTDLATVRTRSKNLQLADFLNDLVGRAYATLYREPRGSILGSIAHGIRLSANTVRKCRWFVAISATLFFGSALFSYMMMSLVPATKNHFVPPMMKDAFEGWKKPFEERTAGESAMMTGFYLSNNPRAAVMAGAISAATFGLGTAYVLYQNGALLGSLAKELEPVGRTGHLFIWISPHGVPELSGIIMSGAAGFVLAWALIHPGRRRRGHALRDAGRDAIILLTTGVVLMFIAAPIEGYFSFNPRVPDGVKIAFAVVSLAAWLAFWAGFGKEDPTISTAPRQAPASY
ncbi:MAG: hypothetical protein QOJ65_1220 [Fimbriimonadaceae bacterium]|nr:hypothetical protein [Fimbriimonadaceae bacterium]